MARTGKIFDILLAGYFGFGNLGDELLLEAALKNLERCGVSRDKIAALSKDPEDTRSRFGIEAFNRWNISAVWGALDRSRLMIMPGGGLFQDATSWRSCVYYWGLVRIAAAKSTPTALLGQSVGPLSGKFARLLTKDALARCTYLAVRDKPSEKILNYMQIPYEVMPDPVLSFEVENIQCGGAVLVNVRPVTQSDKYLRPVIHAAKKLFENGNELIGIAMSDEDATLMRDLKKSGELPLREIFSPKNLAEFLKIAGFARAAMGMRLHFGILSSLCGLSVALSPYDPKVSSFAETWGIKQLKNGESGENFDIMLLLTNLRLGDKKNFVDSRYRVAIQFKKALERILGEENGSG